MYGFLWLNGLSISNENSLICCTYVGGTSGLFRKMQYLCIRDLVLKLLFRSLKFSSHNYETDTERKNVYAKDHALHSRIMSIDLIIDHFCQSNEFKFKWNPIVFRVKQIDQQPNQIYWYQTRWNLFYFQKTFFSTKLF